MMMRPPLRAARFEQIEPGDLFIYIDGGDTFYALKTQALPGGEQGGMVLLGPQFVAGTQESFLLNWQAVTVLSLGKNFSILPSLNPADWSADGPMRQPVCLAVVDEKIYICTNGATSPMRFNPCFVDVASGTVVERRPPGIAAFTNTWKVAVLSPDHPPRVVLQYPLNASNPSGS